MPATNLRCRVCETEQPLDGIGTCPRCFGPLDPVYDLEALRAQVSRQSIKAGPASLWRYAEPSHPHRGTGKPAGTMASGGE